MLSFGMRLALVFHWNPVGISNTSLYPLSLRPYRPGGERQAGKRYRPVQNREELLHRRFLAQFPALPGGVSANARQGQEGRKCHPTQHLPNHRFALIEVNELIQIKQDMAEVRQRMILEKRRRQLLLPARRRAA